MNAADLHDAARQGNLDAIHRAMNADIPVDSRDEEGYTPLLRAAQAGQTDAVRLLLKYGADIDAEKPNGATALALATQEGETPIVQLLLSRGAKTELYRRPEPEKPPTPEEQAEREKMMTMFRAMAEEEGPEALAEFEKEQSEFKEFEQQVANEPPRPISLLMSAITSGNPKTLHALLEAGIKPEPVGEEPFAMHPLVYAISFHDLEMARLLLEFGADPNYSDGTGSILMRAVMANDPAIVRLLLEAGADPENGLHGMTALIFAAGLNRKEVIPVLLEFGAKPMGGAELPLLHPIAEVTPGMSGFLKQQIESDWQEAVTAGDMETVRARLDDGADVNGRDLDGKTALMQAALKGNAEMARLLIERGADVHMSSPLGMTAVHWAASRGHTDVLRLLLASRADSNPRNRRHFTPMFLAARNGYAEAVAVLREAGVPYGLPEAAACGDRATVEAFLERGTPVDYAEESGMTALMGAAARGDRDLMALLLDRGANIEAQDATGDTPLHYAIDRRQPEAARFLLDSGADVHARDQHGSPPVHSTLFSDRLPLLQLLLERGAVVEAKKVFELLATAAGMQKRFPEHDLSQVFETLFKNGVDPNMCNDEGQTLLYFAVRQRAPLPLVETLISHGADLNTRVRNGETALYQAVERGQNEYARLLLEAGADPNADVSVVSALDIAVKRGDTKLAEALVARGGKPSAWLERFDIAPEEKQTWLRIYGPSAAEEGNEGTPAASDSIPLAGLRSMPRKWDRLRAEGIEPR